MNSSKLTLKSIKEVIDQKSFLIPSYQRGYRWTSRQVSELLSDLFYFMSNKQSSTQFYCLQPIILCNTLEGSNANWELIDGQQRLTTIYIILSYFNNRFTEDSRLPLFDLEYKTREGSREFLKNIDISKKDDNIDYFFICEAYNTVKNYFEDKKNLISKYEDTLQNDVKVIWYEINRSEENPIDIFTRINIGKIPLTNAELIKGLFLQKSNFIDSIELRQIQIATEWDEIEKKLQQDSFWFFITNNKSINSVENRIDFLFNLIYDKNQTHDDLFTFHKYNELFNQYKLDNKTDFVLEEWIYIKRYFQRIEEWYNNHNLYHLIGFLVDCNVSIPQLIELSVRFNKDEFELELIKLIKNEVKGVNLDTIEYNENGDNKNLKKTLLLFNIQTILSSHKATYRFPFDKYKKDNWHIEHIHSQTNKQFDYKKD